MNKKRIFYLLLLMFFPVSQLICQIGINTIQPHESSILEINGGGTRGLIIPEVDSEERNAMLIRPLKKGLMVFDTDDNMYYFFNGTTWQSINPWNADVNNNVQTAENATVNKDLTVKGNSSVNGTVTANTFVGNGTIPVDGIIMWSGNKSSVPQGWALCDGNWYNPNNNNDNATTQSPNRTKKTPDLSGKFIVGIGKNSSPDVREDYEPTYLIGNTGGINKYKLSSTESGLPRHDHTINHNHTINDPGHSHEIKTGRNGGNGNITKEDRYNSDFKETEPSTTGITLNSFVGNSSEESENATISHENRPAYYALAFIMRIK